MMESFLLSTLAAYGEFMAASQICIGWPIKYIEFRQICDKWIYIRSSSKALLSNF